MAEASRKPVNVMRYDYRAYNANPHGPTGAEAARIVGVSRRTIHRWIEEGRLPYPLTYDALSGVQPRKRGPKCNPLAVRYTRGRHSFKATS